MENWTVKKVEEFVEFNPRESIKLGSMAKKIAMDKLGVFTKKINGYELAPFQNSTKFKNGDVLLAKITPCLENGKTALVDLLDEGEIGFGSTEFIVLRANEYSTSDFIYYLAISPIFRKKAISCMEGTSGRKRVNEKVLKEQMIALPDLPTQQKIASVLSNLDAKIALNRQINTQLEQMAKLLYEYWFVQFDFPDTAGKPYKSSGGKMLWNSELKREIPEGWEVGKLGDWINENKSGDWGKDEPQGNYQTKVICIRGTDINGLNGTDGCNPPTRYILEKNEHKILNSHDLIVEISGGAPTQSTGRLGYITEATLNRFDSPLICSNFCKAISLKNPKLLYNFVYQWNNLYDAGVLFGYEGKTSGIKNLLFESFVDSYLVVMPQFSVIEKFYDFIQIIQNQKQINLKETQELTALRDWLLPMLMNGQVRVG